MKISRTVGFALGGMGTAFLLGACATTDPVRTAELPLTRPIAIEDVADNNSDATPALDEWQAKHHADIVDDPMPIIKDGKLTGWRVRLLPSENPYLWHFGYSRVEAIFTLTGGGSLAGVLNRFWRWRSATLGFAGRAVYLNCTATPLTLITSPVPINDPELPRGSDNRDVLDVDVMNIRSEQDVRIYGFWYVYHDPSFSIVFDDLLLKVPLGFASAEEYLEHRKQLESMRAPTLTTRNGRLEFKDPNVLVADDPLLMERFVLPSGWLELQPFSRTVNGPVVMVKIRGVTAGTPIYRAGIREGEILRTYQGATLAGLTKAELNQVVMQPLHSDLRLELQAAPRARPREVVIPLAQLRQALSAKDSPAAGKSVR